jgi:putative nucleotidyltransferase with HDIG domain
MAITEELRLPSADTVAVVIPSTASHALTEGEHVFGWLAALNHIEGGEFGDIEASLLSSVAAIFGIHGGNLDLYRKRSELLVEIIRALTAAVDAKDPYTCGHSDRVARVAVRLAEELGCDAETVDSLYLAGLLHDIGKIGIDDSILRKAGTLSDDEYEHIKAHVSIGHRILNDLAKLEDVLPVVLHHHESWDGGGYPSHLDSHHIPLPARIVAVADAFDAMSSDRPYRKAMPDETVDRILKTGAGHQWDPEVISAFFRVREDIRRICREQPQSGELELSRFRR